jgi:hypothetical protein
LRGPRRWRQPALIGAFNAALVELDATVLAHALLAGRIFNALDSLDACDGRSAKTVES